MSAGQFTVTHSKRIMAKAAPSTSLLNGKSEHRSDDVLRHIVGLIFEGQIGPGSRLPSERELSESLGVSRTTLRDAMNRLRARGYIESRSKSGNYVCTAIPQSLSTPIEDVVEANVVGFGDIIEIREILEVWAVARAAENSTAPAIAKLQKCIVAMKASGTLKTEELFTKFGQADLQFHQTIAEMTGNPIYIHLIHFIGHLITRSIKLSRDLITEGFAARNLEVHQNIYDSICNKNPDAAREAMVEHFAFVKKHIRQPGRRKRS